MPLLVPNRYSRIRRRKIVTPSNEPEEGSSDLAGPWHYVGESGEPTINSPWVDAGPQTDILPALSFRRRGENVDLAGAVFGGTAGSVIFTLPVGFRPSVGAWGQPAINVDISGGPSNGLNLFSGILVDTDGDVHAGTFGPTGTYTLVSLVFAFHVNPSTEP